MLESLFNRLAGFKTCNFVKKRLQDKCFLVNIAKFLKILILIKICKQLLLPFLLPTVNISSLGLVSALNSIGLLQRSSSRFKEFSLGYLVVGSSLIWKKEKLAKLVTRCHSLSLAVPLVVIRCYSLSLVVPLVAIRCHSLSFVVTILSFVVLLVVTHCHLLYHSLSFVVTRCHSLSLVVTRCHWMSFIVPLVVTGCHSLCHSLSLDAPLVCLLINDQL